MISVLPELYFRLRDNGATVFCMVDDARNGRLDMTQIATVNLRSGEYKPRVTRTCLRRIRRRLGPGSRIVRKACRGGVWIVPCK